MKCQPPHQIPSNSEKSRMIFKKLTDIKSHITPPQKSHEITFGIFWYFEEATISNAPQKKNTNWDINKENKWHIWNQNPHKNLAQPKMLNKVLQFRLDHGCIALVLLPTLQTWVVFVFFLVRVCVFDVVFISFFAISPDLMDLILFAGMARKDIYTVYIMEKN